MAAKRVASALDVLTSDGVVNCEEWSDHISCAVFVADYFTTGSDDSSEESDSDDTGNILYIITLYRVECCIHVHRHCINGVH